MLDILHILGLVVLAQTSTLSATLIPTQPLSPTPTISLVLTNVPDGAYKGQLFTVNLVLTNARPASTYSFKVFGGPVGDNYSINILNNGNTINGYNGSWASMPATLTDGSGNASLSLSLQADPGKNSGQFQITGKAAETANTNKSLLSNSVIIQINDAPTPTPTATPPNSPTPSFTPTPTPTRIPTPTVIPTDTPSPFPTETPPPDSNVLSESITSGLMTTPTTKLITQKTSASLLKPDLLPVFLIALGGIIILIPLIVSRLKK